jgi:threonyl-tRNA synthetase
MENEKLNHLRHSAAHLLAAAVMEIWPDTKRTMALQRLKDFTMTLTLLMDIGKM